MNTKIPTTTLAIALIYVLSPMASATDTTTPQDVINKVLRVGSDYSWRNREDANSAINRMDPSMWEEFRREIRVLADSLSYSTGREPPQRISLGNLSRGMAIALPVEKAIEILSQDILNMEDEFDLYVFTSAFHSSLRLSQLETQSQSEVSPQEHAHDKIILVMDAIYAHVLARPFRGDHIAQDTLQYIMEIYGMCGDDGFERLIAIDGYEEWRFPILAGMNVPASREYLLNQYHFAPRKHVQIQAAKVIARILDKYDTQNREEFLADIRALAASPNPPERRRAINLAKISLVPELLPSLEAIALSDPHVETRTRNGLQEQYHPLRIAAENVIHEIKRRTDPVYGKIIRLTESVANAQQDIQRYQQNLAVGIDPETTQMRLRAAQERLERYQTELAELQAQPTLPLEWGYR